MKKIIVFIVLLVGMIIFPIADAYARSYTIDEVQIRGWISPNGDILVNEVFKYTFDGPYTETLRSFPEEHFNQIESIEAYKIHADHPQVGEITEDMLEAIPVKIEKETIVAEIGLTTTDVYVFYVYTLQDAVISYDEFSDLSITYFEDGSNHDIDIDNLQISYVLPDDAGEGNVHGFFHDRHGTVSKVHRNGIVFETPKSEAYTTTSTRLFFPSWMMADQEKKKMTAPLSYFLETEQKKIDAREAKLKKIPIISKVFVVISISFIILSMLLLLLPQRWFFLRGNSRFLLETDPVYLMFMAQRNERNSKGFLAALFSLVEKGKADVSVVPIHDRYRKNPKAGNHTLEFQMKDEANGLLTHENALISWLFKPGEHEKLSFRLDDIAIVPEGQESINAKEEIVERRKDFHKRHDAWHKEVNRLLKEAGTYTDVFPKVLKISILVLLPIFMLIAMSVDLKDGSSLVLMIITGCYLITHFLMRLAKRWIVAVYFVFLFVLTFDIANSDLSASLFLLHISSVLLYYVTPSIIITSKYALQVKQATRSFRAETRRGFPKALSKKEQEQWLTRAYLLRKPASQLPFSKEDFSSSLALSLIFKAGIDPLYFVQKTWGVVDNKIRGVRSRSSGGGSGGGGAGAR